MTEIFRSALNYLSGQTTPVPAAVIGRADHPLVGTGVEVGGLRLKIRSLIAEGGYALVFSAQDAQGNWFALKRQLAADREAADAIIKEIRVLRDLTGHPSIIRYVQAAQLNPQESGHGRAEFLLVTELCSGGNVVEMLQKRAFTPSQIMKIFYASCCAVRHMHCRKPPITHRDIKVENLLFDSCGFVKLCDFGSATTETYAPDDSWSAMKRTQLEEELARHTTPMYRSPEILDMYSNFPIGPAQDVWALGCILFYLCYRRHPFEDSAKLRILNAKYVLPDSDAEYTMFHPLIQSTLMVDPSKRPLINDLCERAHALAVAIDVDVTKPVEGLDLLQMPPPGQAAANATSGQLQREVAARGGEQQPPQRGPPPPRPPPSAVHRVEHGEQQSAQQQASAVFGAIKGQGMSWFKNIKDRTAAVAQTVQSTYGGRGPDVTYITSRLVIAPLADGVPEALAVQAEDAMRSHILEQARGQFAIYNLSQRHLRCDYSNRLSETPMPTLGSGITPTLKMVIGLCRNMALFLRQKDGNFVVVTGPEAQCVFLACALLIYGRLVSRSLSALELICSKRGTPAPQLPSSYHRTLDLLATIVSSTTDEIRAMVHNRTVVVKSMSIAPPPMFNRARTGCRPFVEVHCSGAKVWSGCKDYELLRQYEVSECQSVELNVGDVPVAGDVQLLAYHARWSKMHNRMQSHLMFSMGFHANFLDPNSSVIEALKGDLDTLLDDDTKFVEPFRVQLQVHVDAHDRGFLEVPPFLSYDATTVSRLTLVTDPEEYDSIARLVGPSRHRVTPAAARQVRLSGGDPTPLQSSSSSSHPGDWRAVVPEGEGDGMSQHRNAGGFPTARQRPEGESLLSDTAEEQETVARGGEGNFFSTLQWDSGGGGQAWGGGAPPQARQNVSVARQEGRSSSSTRGVVDEGTPRDAPRKSPTQPTTAFDQKPQLQADPGFNAFAGATPFETDRAMGGAPPSSAQRGVDVAEACERMSGIRVGKVEEDADADQYKFDYEKTAAKQHSAVGGDPPMGRSMVNEGAASDADLLGLGSDFAMPSQFESVHQSSHAYDPFSAFESSTTTSTKNVRSGLSVNSSAHKSASSANFVEEAEDDLLMWSTVKSPQDRTRYSQHSGMASHTSGMQRNVSAPSFASQTASGGGATTTQPTFDPFADFLAFSGGPKPASAQLSSSNAGSKNALNGGSCVNSGRATPSNQRPNYSRSHFDAINSIGGVKPKVTENAFDDLLTSQGFMSSASRNAKSMSAMRRDDETRDMDPVAIKIRDWTQGKERNIRALLGSMNDVMWPGSEKWEQPSMADLLTPAQVKKYYRKACLTIHPDKQTGTENEPLARAIFTVLNDAYTSFEASGSPSIQ